MFHIWLWFLELHRTRTYYESTGKGRALQYSEIDAWARLSRNNPHPWEIDLIVEIDLLFRVGAVKSLSSEKSTVVDVTDGAGVKNLMRGFMARQKGQ